MDVYGLILDKGILGAMSYANKIDRTNYRLASKIDYATDDLIKISQFQPMQFVQPAAPPAQLNQGPTSAPQLIGPEKQVTDEELVRIFGPDILKEKPVQGNDFLGINNFWWETLRTGLAIGLTPLATRYWVQRMQLNKVTTLVNDIQNINLLNPLSSVDSAEKIKELTDIIDRAPGPLKTSLARNPINIKGALIKKIIDSVKNPQIADEILMGVLDNSTIRNKAVHPILKNNNKLGYLFGNGRTQLQSDISDLIKNKKIKVSDLYGKTISELEEIMISNGKTMPKISSALPQAGAIRTRAINGVADSIVDAGEASKTGMIGKLMTSASQKFPFLKTVLPFVAKIAGPLFVVLSAKNLYDDYVKLNGKVDSKWWCEFLACLASIAALVPPLTPIAGPLALALNVGCMFFKREEKKDPSQLMPSDYKNRMANITREQLSQKDVGMVDSLFNEYSSNKKLLQQSFEAIKDKFDNPLDSGAYLMKRYKEMGESGVAQQAPANIESLRGSLSPEQFNLVKSTMPAMA